MRNPTVHIDELQHRTTADVPACPICKRRPQDGHDSYCTPERRANAEVERLAIDPPAPMTVRQGQPLRLPPTFGRVILPAGLAARFDTPTDDRKEPTVTTLAEAAAAWGLPAPSADRPEPKAAKACTRCTQTDVEFGMGGRDSICKGCRKKILADARARRSGSSGSVNETPIATTAAVECPLVDVTDETFAPGSEADPGDETTELDAIPTELVAGTPVISLPAPIDQDIAIAEQQSQAIAQRLEDLQAIRDLMADDIPALERWQRLVAEAIARKRAEMGVA